MRPLRTLIVGLALLSMSGSAFAGGYDGPAPPSPIFVPGARSVETRNASGGLTRQTTIPTNSEFATHGGSSSATCQFTPDTAGTTSNGHPYTAGQTVISTKWLFREVPSSFSPEPSPGDNTLHGTNNGPLDHALRYFAVYCDTRFHLIRASIAVTVNDPMLNPRPAATDLYNRLQLQQPVIYPNPVINIWGGLVTRYPVWLAIQPAAWQPQNSEPAHFLGWTLLLLTEPHTLEFDVHFTPNPDKPSTPFNGIVPCITDPTTATADTDAFPAMPTLPDQTEPGTNGPCTWTPPGPGQVTIQARITYTVTLWANGYTEPQPDYTWTSEPATYTTGELTAVNTNN